jgi:hypothetical protein
VFDARNYKLFGLGSALLVVGYVLLGNGPANNPLSLSVAPVILVGTYCVLFPLAIFLRPKKRENAEVQENKGV